MKFKLAKYLNLDIIERKFPQENSLIYQILILFTNFIWERVCVCVYCLVYSPNACDHHDCAKQSP